MLLDINVIYVKMFNVIYSLIYSAFPFMNMIFNLICFGPSKSFVHVFNSFAANFLTILFSQCHIYFYCKG